MARKGLRDLLSREVLELHTWCLTLRTDFANVETDFVSVATRCDHFALIVIKLRNRSFKPAHRVIKSRNWISKLPL